MVFGLTLMAALFVAGSPASAQTADSTRVDAAPDPPREGVSWIVLPSAFYTPETGIAGGVAGQAVFRRGEGRRPSTLSGVLTVTQNEQLISEVLFERYLSAYRLSGKVGLTRWPDSFYGVGDNLPASAKEAYTARILNGHLEVQRAVGRALRLGAQFDARQDRFLEVEPDGQLAAGGIPGSRSYRVVGVGWLADWDTRDNLFAARRGVFYRVSGVVHPSVLGSDFTMGKYLVDLRHYIPLGETRALAVQAYGSFTVGTSPFAMLPMLGGPRLMRGYLRTRYRDRHMLILQAEVRIPVWWRFRAVVFGGAGDVAPRPESFRVRDVKWSGGGGLRFAVSPDERIHLRLDYGFGAAGSKLYVTVNEAI